jgi:type III pantothenate kinase
MSVLLIDAGNTRIKWATASGASDEIRTGFNTSGVFGNVTIQDLLKVPKPIEITNIICSSVISKEKTIELKKLCQDLMPSADWHQINGASALDQLPTSYSEPQQLGADRRSMLLGAQHLFAGKNVLVIGTGTATTIDLIANQKHLGGWIFPGITLMAETLSKNTANLPNILEKIDSLSSIKPAVTTEEGIEQGIFACQTGAISIARQYAKDNNLQIDLTVLSGGNSNLISQYLESQGPVTTEPQLVLKGLLAWHLMNCSYE